MALNFEGGPDKRVIYENLTSRATFENLAVLGDISTSVSHSSHSSLCGTVETSQCAAPAFQGRAKHTHEFMFIYLAGPSC